MRNLENSSRLEQDGRVNRVEAATMVLSIFSFGKDPWEFCESWFISVEVNGPAVFLWARAIPNFVKMCCTIKRLAAGMVLVAEIIRKSSWRFVEYKSRI